MNTKLLSLLAILSLGLGGFAAAGPKSYQVTGPVLAVTDDSVTVQKGDDKWEIARDAKTKITGDLKVGAKVTVEYTMSAATVEVKAGDTKGGKPDKKKK
ncbi:MAG TPA: hypothetical protein VGH65_10645 [Verrucomicrobiaceae bacterium]